MALVMRCEAQAHQVDGQDQRVMQRMWLSTLAFPPPPTLLLLLAILICDVRDGEDRAPLSQHQHPPTFRRTARIPAEGQQIKDIVSWEPRPYSCKTASCLGMLGA